MSGDDTLELSDDTELLKVSELFPRKDLVSDDASIPLPFVTLWGESILFLGRCGKKDRDVIALSTYRLAIVAPRQWFTIVPVGAVLAVDSVDACAFFVRCKDGRSFRAEFALSEQCTTWLSRINVLLVSPAKVQDHYAFAYHAWLKDNEDICPAKGYAEEKPYENFRKECTRLGLCQPLWRISDGNSKFELCRSYPKLVVVPAVTKDDSLQPVCKAFRSVGRFPAVLWRHAKNGAVLARCAQPLVGFLGFQRCEEDEELVANIAKTVMLDRLQQAGKLRLAEKGPPVDLSSVAGDNVEIQEALDNASLLLVDMRTYTAAIGNRTRGGGTESKEYYPCIDLVHHDIPNIHSVRASFESLAALCANEGNTLTWLSQLEKTSWLSYLSGLLSSACQIAYALDVQGRPVLVHCSDGWDRTSQATSLAQLLLDPHYRTIDGFRKLVEREWLSFGHKFASRCAQSAGEFPPGDEFSPIFLQWLDAVHQLAKQFPTAFEFCQGFLVHLSQHIYSRLFGTFLCNNERERAAVGVARKTLSVWEFLSDKRLDWINHIYQSGAHQVLRPKVDVRHLTVWSELFLRPLRQSFHPSSTSCGAPHFVSTQMSSAPISQGKFSSHSHERPDSDSRRVSSICSVTDLNIEAKPTPFSTTDTPGIRARHFSEGDLLSSSYENVSLGSSPTTAGRAGPLQETSLRVAALVGSPVTCMPTGHLQGDASSLGGRKLPRKVVMEEVSSSNVDTDLLAEAVSDIDVGWTQHRKRCGEDSGCPSESASPSPHRQPSRQTSQDKTGERNVLIPPRLLDVDGLPRVSDPAQIHLTSREQLHKDEVIDLERKIHSLKEKVTALTQQLARHDDQSNDDVSDRFRREDDILQFDDDGVSEELTDPSSYQSVSSLSWVKVSSQEAECTKWVPDHAAPNCYGCYQAFWIANRRHHCRNCGEVFCGTCSNYFVPIPKQQLLEPVRVCFRCYDLLDGPRYDQSMAAGGD